MKVRILIQKSDAAIAVVKALVLRGGKMGSYEDPNRDAKFSSGKPLSPAQHQQRVDAANSPRRKRGNRTSLLGDLEKRGGFSLVTNGDDVDTIHEQIVGSDMYDAFLVKIMNGKYNEVWGFEGSQPRRDKRAFRLV